MRLTYQRLFVLLLLSYSTLTNARGQAPLPLDILSQTFSQTRQIKTLSYTMTKEERIDGKMVKQVSFSKLNRNPLKVYIRQQFPKEGLEVLFTGANKALVNPNGFPWFNLRLSPTGSIMRENQHHTILESGYDHVINILEHLVLKYDSVIHSMLYLETESTWDTHPVWVVKLKNPYYRISSYRMQPEETVMQVARRRMISEYWIVEHNEAIKNCEDKAPGTDIELPNDYSNGMELLIDKKRLIPLVMKIYDHKGLFEHYSYTDVILDPVFKEQEFQKDYPGYGF